jgi:hypothetical protein
MQGASKNGNFFAKFVKIRRMLLQKARSMPAPWAIPPQTAAGPMQSAPGQTACSGAPMPLFAVKSDADYLIESLSLPEKKSRETARGIGDDPVQKSETFYVVFAERAAG